MYQYKNNDNDRSRFRSIDLFIYQIHKSQSQLRTEWFKTPLPYSKIHSKPYINEHDDSEQPVVILSHSECAPATNDLHMYT